MSGVLTRRRLLQSGGAAVAGMAVAGLPAFARVAPDVGSAVLLKRSTFVPLVGDTFRLGGVAARLAVIDDYGRGRVSAATGAQDAFALIFHAARGARRLEQDVMAVSHPRLGTVQLLVSPAGTGRRGQDYTVVVDTRRAPRPRP